MKNIIWLFLLVLFNCIQNNALTEEVNMSSEIEKINHEVREANTNLNYYEKRYLNLIATNASPEIKGEISFAILNMYNRDLKNNYRKVIYYSQATLKYDSNVLHQCEACFYWGDAIRAGKDQVFGAKVKEKLGDPVVPYLKGLAIVLQNLTIQKPQRLPGVGKYSIFSNDPSTDPFYQEIVKKRERQMAIRKEGEIQNQLLAYRPGFRQQIWLVCPEMKSNASKVNEMVKHAVADTNSADKVIQYLLRPVTNERLDASQDMLIP